MRPGVRTVSHTGGPGKYTPIPREGTESISERSNEMLELFGTHATKREVSKVRVGAGPESHLGYGEGHGGTGKYTPIPRESMESTSERKNAKLGWSTMYSTKRGISRVRVGAGPKKIGLGCEKL